MAENNQVEELHKAVVALGGHVAAMVRTSNAVKDMLADLEVEGLSATTKSLVMARVKELHEQFRTQHFRGSIDSMNATFDIVDRMYQAEVPAAAPAEPAPDKPAEPAAPAEPAPEKPADAPAA